MNRAVAVGLAIAGLSSWYWPGFNGIWFSPSNVTTGEGHIIGAILIVGAAIVWFIRSSDTHKN
jgi:hypothetical protein